MKTAAEISNLGVGTRRVEKGWSSGGSIFEIDDQVSLRNFLRRVAHDLVSEKGRKPTKNEI